MVPHKHDGILYGVSIHDPLSFVCASTIVLFFAGLAGFLPGFRATRIDPARTLREE
jgi:ABC-type antimicrobial peptide transport system permease subunit